MGAGTLSDIYDAHERGRAMALYTCGPLLGPALG
jgi:MFS family permease